MAHTLVRRKQEGAGGALETLQDEINRLFDMSFLKGRGPEAGLFPMVDIAEDRDNVYVEADVPGFEQKDINVSVTEDSLVLSAEKEDVREEQNRNWHRTERFRGSFYREIGLPATIDVSNVKASYRNGVLRVALPKKEETRGREIKVNVE